MAQCLKPFFVKDGNGKQVLIPCQKCMICKKRRVSMWSFRLLQELKKSTSAHFITLTYDDTNMPITRNGYRSLCRNDLTLFFKRLRRSHPEKGLRGRTIKYLSAGEYGGKVGRPHYHCILFNADITKIQKAWSTPYVVDTTIRLKRRNRYGQFSKIIKEVKWRPLGSVHYGDKRGVTGASIGYCLKYCLKPKQHNRHKTDDSEFEFLTFSKGLGLDYIYQHPPVHCMAWNDQTGKKQKVLLQPGKLSSNVRWHHEDMLNRMYVNVGDGKKAAMPRYYKDRIYSDKDRQQITEHMRNKMAEEILQDLFKLSAKSYAKKEHDKREFSKHQYKLQSQLKQKSYG